MTGSSTIEHVDRKELIEAIRSHALEFGDFTLKSGAKSKFYLDVRKVSLSGSLHLIVRELHRTMLENIGTSFDAIGGPCVGADPIVGGWLALFGYFGYNRRGCLIRKEEKGHGKSGLIIGSIQKNDRVVVVEDVTTSGGSLLAAVDAIQEYGAKVVLAVTVVDRLQGATKAFHDRGIPFAALTDIREIVPAEYLAEQAP